MTRHWLLDFDGLLTAINCPSSDSSVFDAQLSFATRKPLIPERFGLVAKPTVCATIRNYAYPWLHARHERQQSHSRLAAMPLVATWAALRHRYSIAGNRTDAQPNRRASLKAPFMSLRPSAVTADRRPGRMSLNRTYE